MKTLLPYTNMIGRVFIAAIFIAAGLNKVSAYAATQGYMESAGVSGELLPLVIVLEVAGALAVMVGWQTRIVASALAAFTLLSAILFHSNLGDQTQFIMFMKNVAIAGGFLFLVANGGGAFSLDNRRPTRVSSFAQ